MENTHPLDQHKEHSTLQSFSGNETNKAKGVEWVKTGWRLFKRFWTWAAYAIGSVVLLFILVGILITVLGGSFTETKVADERYLYGNGPSKIAVISVEGVIGEVGSSVLGGGAGVSAERIRAELDQAKNDPLVEAVVLAINSPGGSAVVSDQIYQIITDFREDTDKFVVASMGDTAASGGYYVAAAADKIVANPSTLTGSIGVIMEYFNAQGLLNNLGVESEVVKSGRYKDIGSFTRETTDEERQILQSLIDGAHSQFVDRVADGRGMERSKIAELADGRIYTGAQAKENGLVDALGNLEIAVDEAAKLADISNPQVVQYTQEGWFGGILDSAVRSFPLWAVSQVSPLQPQTSLQYMWKP